MTLTSPPTSVAALDAGYLNEPIAAGDATVTVAPIYKWIDGEKTKQGFDTTAGLAVIEFGGKKERISFESKAVDGTTKVTTLSSCLRGLSFTSTSPSYVAGTGMTFPKGSKITVVADASYFQDIVTKAGAQTVTGLKTFSGGINVSGKYVGLPVHATTGARDTAIPSPSNGQKVYVTGVGEQTYTAGSWVTTNATGTSIASTTVAGTVEEATAAEVRAQTAAGDTGARLFINPSVTKKSSSGAAEGDIPALNASTVLDPTLGGSGRASATEYAVICGGTTTTAAQQSIASVGSAGQVLTSNGASALPTFQYLTTLFGKGTDGAPTWTSGGSLNPAGEFNYTTATLPAGQTLTVSTVNIPLVIHNTGNVTINGTVNMTGKGGAGGTCAAGVHDGTAGTAGTTLVSGWTVGAGGAGTSNGSYAASGGSGASMFTAGTVGTTNSTSTPGTAGALISANKLAFLSSILRGVGCGGGGAAGCSTDAANQGGAGGAGGGALVWFIGGDLVLGADSIIQADGVAGGNGTYGSAGQDSGGSGGGGGTVIILVAGTITDAGVALSAAAGAAGTYAGAGVNGVAGVAGKIIIYSLSSGTLLTA